MEELLTGYNVNQPTWLYLSMLLTIAMFFRFRRFFSLRNLDLVMLLGISPGVLMVLHAPNSVIGYSWMFAVTGLILVRTLCDSLWRRRPKLEPNMSTGGMLFLAFAAFCFLMTEAVTRPASPSTVATIAQAEQITHPGTVIANPAEDSPTAENSESPAGPATSLLVAPVVTTTRQIVNRRQGNDAFGIVEQTAARIFAILSHIAILMGLFFIGRYEFQETQSGVSMATLYLLLPCTAYNVSDVNQVLPAALILWAIAFHSRPYISAIFMGLSCGTMFFPIFLLPVWISYYSKSQLRQFLLSLGIVASVILASAAWVSPDSSAFLEQTIGRIDVRFLSFQTASESVGFWKNLHPAYRIPLMVGFLVLTTVLTIWPWKKSLSQLMVSTTVIVVATQFWYPQQGSVYVLWYIPLLLLLIFKPQSIGRRNSNAMMADAQKRPLSSSASLRAAQPGAGNLTPQ